jgi:hypothetical protein
MELVLGEEEDLVQMRAIEISSSGHLVSTRAYDPPVTHQYYNHLTHQPTRSTTLQNKIV